jgi:hypothetical protein
MTDKENQKRLITEIMNEDAKDGIYQEQTAVDWLYKELYSTPRTLWEDQITKIFDQAREIEKERRNQSRVEGYRKAMNDANEYLKQEFNKFYK